MALQLALTRHFFKWRSSSRLRAWRRAHWRSSLLAMCCAGMVQGKPRIFWIFRWCFFRKVELFAYPPGKDCRVPEKFAGRECGRENPAGHYFPPPRKIDV
ncbi:MAG TPA: hypothetical protein VHC39_19340 [Rhizomicrobium sp.]|nr:hypothetical protein [Rhizomicrobium sp.]